MRDGHKPPRAGYIAAGIDAYLQKHCDAYHTPGHKGTACTRDITELGQSGEIFPADAVELAERAVAEKYASRRMRFLTGGSSMGIKAALLLFRGQTVLYAAGVHRAFCEGCALAGVRAVPIAGPPTVGGMVYTCGCDTLPPPPTCAQVEQALDAVPQARAVFLTSPDYLGRTADGEIAALCRRRGVRLLVDAAHGAHFAFAPGLERFRFDGKADVCNMSAHKTLGAYTQSALLSVGAADLDAAVDENLRLLGTTSPNYVLLERLEQSVYEAAACGKEYLRLQAFRHRLASVVRLRDNDDYTRLCVVPRSGTAAALFRRLAADGIMPEAVIEDSVVLILTPYDDEEKTRRLYEALVSFA